MKRRQLCFTDLLVDSEVLGLTFSFYCDVDCCVIGEILQRTGDVELLIDDLDQNDTNKEKKGRKRESGKGLWVTKDTE